MNHTPRQPPCSRTDDQHRLALGAFYFKLFLFFKRAKQYEVEQLGKYGEIITEELGVGEM